MWTLKKRFHFGLSLLLVSLFVVVNCKQYELVFDNEDIFTPCEKFPDSFIDKYLDLSEFNFDSLDDNVIHAHGIIKLIAEFDMDRPVTAIAETFKQSRSEWVSTIYNMKRPDVCPDMYDENQIWYQFTKLVPEDSRDCPPKAGWTLDFDTNITMVMDLSDNRADGQYKLELRFGQGEDLMCVEILFNVYPL